MDFTCKTPTHRFALPLPRDGVGHHHVVHTSRAGRPSDRASHATNWSRKHMCLGYLIWLIHLIHLMHLMAFACSFGISMISEGFATDFLTDSDGFSFPNNFAARNAMLHWSMLYHCYIFSYIQLSQHSFTCLVATALGSLRPWSKFTAFHSPCRIRGQDTLIFCDQIDLMQHDVGVLRLIIPHALPSGYD